MKIKVGVSNRHVHLKQSDLDILFGCSLEKDFNLNQPNNFASKNYVTIKTKKNQIDKVRVLGEIRSYTQVEISKTDAYKLGINPPIRNTGDLVGSGNVDIIGPIGQINVDACIIANRHIHISTEDKLKYNLPDKVRIKINGSKGGIIDNVYLKESPNAYFELHLDTDDANAFLIKSDDEVDIID